MIKKKKSSIWYEVVWTEITTECILINQVDTDTIYGSCLIVLFIMFFIPAAKCNAVLFWPSIMLGSSELAKKDVTFCKSPDFTA